MLSLHALDRDALYSDDSGEAFENIKEHSYVGHDMTDKKQLLKSDTRRPYAHNSEIVAEHTNAQEDFSEAALLLHQSHFGRSQNTRKGRQLKKNYDRKMAYLMQKFKDPLQLFTPEEKVNSKTKKEEGKVVTELVDRYGEIKEEGGNASCARDVSPPSPTEVVSPPSRVPSPSHWQASIFEPSIAGILEKDETLVKKEMAEEMC